MAAAWHIWLERNARIFENRSMEESEIWSKIKFTASLWAFSSKSFGDLSASVINNNWEAAIN